MRRLVKQNKSLQGVLMKKYFALCAFIVLLAIAACSSGGGSNDSDDHNQSENKISIFAIDGLNFDRTYQNLFSNDDVDFPTRSGYLCPGILEANVLNIKEDDCFSFTGSDSGGSWSGDATKTLDYLEELTRDLEERAEQAHKEGKKFVVVTHSWGTQLGTLGLSLSGVEPDLLITLSDPEGSIHVSDTAYTNEFFKLIPPLTVAGAEALIQNLVRIYGVGAVSPIHVKAKKWINYWDVGDIISGPLQSVYQSNSIEDKTVINSTLRNFETTRQVHAMTSLNDEFWTKEYGVDIEEATAFRIKVISDIAHAE